MSLFINSYTWCLTRIHDADDLPVYLPNHFVYLDEIWCGGGGFTLKAVGWIPFWSIFVCIISFLHESTVFIQMKLQNLLKIAQSTKDGSIM
jgi:hypothetical protein